MADHQEMSSGDDDDEEPKLKYQRLGASLTHILLKESASCLHCHYKFLVMGTHSGLIYVLDFHGNQIKCFRRHEGAVNDLSLDSAGEYIASCADDGNVVITSLYTPDSLKYVYHRPIRAVSIHPDFEKKKVFAAGGVDGHFIINTKGWFGNKDNVVHSGEGAINAINWAGSFVAWANDSGVKVYDTETNERITHVQRAKGSPPPSIFPCHLCWEGDSTLLIGWADSVTIGVVKERNVDSHVAGIHRRTIDIVAQFQTDCYICGIAPYMDDLVILAYVLESDYDEHTYKTDSKEIPVVIGVSALKKPSGQRPELRIVSKRNVEISSDALPMRGFEHYLARDYQLDYIAGVDPLFLVVSPKDIVVARPFDVDDRIEWLLGHERYEECLQLAENNLGLLHRSKLPDIGEKYLKHLLDCKFYDQAASLCPKLLMGSAHLWKSIIPYIPIDSPQLGDTVYEMVLQHFISEDHDGLLRTIRSWPITIYNIDNVLAAVLHKVNQCDSLVLLETLAELYTLNSQFDQALAVYLRLQHGDVFGLIAKHGLIDAIVDKVKPLIEFDKQYAIDLLIQNIHRIPVAHVVNQLRRDPDLQHEYLHSLFLKDPQAGSDFHELQVSLYAEFQPSLLLRFLTQSNCYILEKALEVCRSRCLWNEVVFILSRMGNAADALDLIIEEIQDIGRAIEFVQEHQDEQLWDRLIDISLSNPEFIGGMLEHIGSHVAGDPLRLIRRVPGNMVIPGARSKLIKIFSDYSMEASLREGCNRILKTDCIALLQQLHSTQHAGIKITELSICSVCDNPVVQIGRSDVIVTFFCGHSMHVSCLQAHRGYDTQRPHCINCHRSASEKRHDRPLRVK